jgi:alginate O-acetyltransferase complex protein AlgI
MSSILKPAACPHKHPKRSHRRTSAPPPLAVPFRNAQVKLHNPNHFPDLSFVPPFSLPTNFLTRTSQNQAPPERQFNPASELPPHCRYNMQMQVASGAYYVFVAAVFFLYWAAARARRARLAVILLANYLFCAQFGVFYALLLPLCSLVDYAIGLGLMRFRQPAVRRLLVGISVALNLTLLIGSRHMQWLLNRHGTIQGSQWDWIFPLGLSFYTFQALTYTMDLYRRDADGTRSLLEHFSAVSFFPTIMAGPITRVADLVKQFSAAPTLSRADGGRAFFLIGLGLMKKTFIADYLAGNFVNRVFDTPNLYSGAEALLAVYAYSLQLYFDFSGYTDIARGVAMLLGIRLPINFDRPYLAANMTEFWRRWHITFSNWLRDYLYFSLPGKRTKVMPYLNLVITMILGGLWHGTTWTFAIWGAHHGIALAVTRLWQTLRGRPTLPASAWNRALRIFCTYQFVCFTWIFFRSASLQDALALLSRIASLTTGLENVSWPLIGVSLIAVASMFTGKKLYSQTMDLFAKSPFYVHASALALVAVALQWFGGRASAPFVYSRF